MTRGNVLPAALVLLDFSAKANRRPYATLSAAGFVVLLLLGMTLWKLWRNRNAKREAQHTILRGVAITILVIALGAVVISRSNYSSSNLVYLMIAPLPTWLLVIFLWPLWIDSDLVLTEMPDEGWVRIWQIRVAYKNPDDPALWVRMSPGYDLNSIGYTPNLGHPWGPFVYQILSVLLAYLGLALAATAA